MELRRQPGGADGAAEVLRLGPAKLSYTGGGVLLIRVPGSDLEVDLAHSGRCEWACRTTEGPYPVKDGRPADQLPLVVLGQGDYRQPLYPSDLTGKPQESDNVTGATAGPGA